MKIFLNYFLLFIWNYKLIYCSKICYEYSCEECESEEYGNCTKCKENFPLIDGTCPCEDFGCALCISGLIGSQCLLCKKGYKLEYNQCMCKQKNCEVCGENKCTKCIRGHHFNNTLNECVKNDCLIPNCEYCGLEDDIEEQNICYRCEEGYYFDNGNCTELVNQVENYEQCPKQDLYEINMYCDAKCDGFGCDIKTALDYIKNCYSNNCIHCSDNILYLYSNCQSNVQCNIEGCNACLTEDICARCDRGYRIDLGLCVKCIEGCSVCSNNYTCDYCLSGYDLDSNKKCVFTNTFDFDVNIYRRTKKALNHESEINEEEETNTNNSTNDISNCNLYGNGKCLECKLGYLLKDGKCKTTCSDPNCLKCEIIDEYNYEICNKCNNNFYNIGQFCYKNCLVPFCQICMSDENYCQICKAGKTNVDGKCLSDYEIKQKNNDDDHGGILIETEKESSNNELFLIYIVICIISLFLIIGLIFFIKKLMHSQQSIQNIREINIENNRIVHYINNDLINSNNNSNRKIVDEKALEKEFEKYKKNIDVLENNECNICFKKQSLLSGFKCGCALRVCKECYIKCKSTNNKCPGCRAII